MTQDVDSAGVRRLAAEGAQVVDVLPADEYAEARLPGAVNPPSRA